MKITEMTKFRIDGYRKSRTDRIRYQLQSWRVATKLETESRKKKTNIDRKTKKYKPRVTYFFSDLASGGPRKE